MPLPVGPLRDLDLEMRVVAEQLIAAGQSITDAQVYMRVRDGVADIEYVRGVLHQGQLDTRVTLNARRPVVEAEVEGGLKGVNMDLLLASMGTPTRRPVALSWAGILRPRASAQMTSWQRWTVTYPRAVRI